MGSLRPIEAVIERMDARLAPLEAADDPRRFFLATYRRTTIAVHEALLTGRFVDPDWVERWDVAFASLYLDALDAADRGAVPPAPWAAAFSPSDEIRLPPLRHVLLGMNAHINYDLPQALLAVIPSKDFDDPQIVARRRADHEQIDAILAARVGAEDDELERVELPGDRTALDRALAPLNRIGTKRFMREARRKVWRNAHLLDAARRIGPEVLATRLGDLEALAEQRISDLRRPGQVLLELARHGFGVELRE